MFKATILVLMAVAAPSMAQIPASPSSTAVGPPRVDPLDKVICRTEEGLGSRLNKKKVCMSLRDWKDQADDSRNATERMQQMNADQKKPDG